MSYTLAAAATATGLSQTTILKAIEDGRIAATRDERGEWQAVQRSVWYEEDALRRADLVLGWRHQKVE